MDSSKIYDIAREQDHYESLAAAGIRALENSSCRLQDCMTMLESNTEAKTSPCRAIRLSKEFGVSLGVVSAAFDEVYKNRDIAPTSIEDKLKEQTQRGTR